MNTAVFYTDTFPCLIRDRERILYKGKALSLTTVNDQGLFDILPNHSNFISIIKDKLDILSPDGKTLSVPVTRAILKVFEGDVKVYLGIFSSISKKS
jgi:F0F1-type ATP synthase epsilon subunit